MKRRSGELVYRHLHWVEYAPDPAVVERVRMAFEPEWRTVFTIAATVLLSGLVTMVLLSVYELAERGMGR